MGQKVGKCFDIYDSNSDVTPRYYNNVVMRTMAKANAVVGTAYEDESLDFKTIKLSYDVSAKFVLE